MDDILTTQKRVCEIIASVLEVESGQIQTGHKFTSDLEADSRKRIEILCALEDHFEIEIDERDAIMIETVGEMVRYIDKLAA